MKTILDKNGRELAVVLKTTDYMQHEDKRFFSTPGDVLQVGSLFFPQDANVPPHRHIAHEAPETPMEILIVLCGDPLADIYGEDGQLVETVWLAVGDILIQKRGGHGFRFPHKAVFLEIKRGPYHGKDSDKEPI